MGCASSTEVTTDPVTGEKKHKHKLGGAYPGNRRQGNVPYMPPASEFNNGQATAHFVAYGGGNALVLVDQANGPPKPVTGAPQPEYIAVTLPAGVNPGDTIHVQAPDGRLNAIIVPAGMSAGSTFTVEFAPGPAPTNMTSYAESTETTPFVPATMAQPEPAPFVPATAAPPPSSTADDGFASGFNSSGPAYPSAPSYPSAYGR